MADESIMGLAVPTMIMGGLMGLIMREMDNMFGEQEKIPKGVVKELMEGVLEGVFGYFQAEIFELKEANKKLSKENDELDIVNDDLKTRLSILEKEFGKKVDELSRLRSKGKKHNPRPAR